MTRRDGRFVEDGASRLARHDRERVKRAVAVEFAPRIAQSRGLQRLVLQYWRWWETRRRIQAVRSPKSPYINWLEE